MSGLYERLVCGNGDCSELMRFCVLASLTLSSDFRGTKVDAWRIVSL